MKQSDFSTGVIEKIKETTLLLLYICLIEQSLRAYYLLNDIFSPLVIRLLERYHSVREKLTADDFDIYIAVLSCQKIYNNEQILKRMMDISKDFLPNRGCEILQCPYDQKFFQEVLIVFNWFRGSIEKCIDGKTLYIVACAAYYSGELTIAKEYFLSLKKQGSLDKSLDDYLLWIENRQRGKEDEQ